MENILKVAKKLEKVGKKLYIVGGYCRDKILGIENSLDTDLVTDMHPDELKNVLNVISEIGKKYGTSIIKEGNEVFEITSFRKDIGTVNNRKPAEVKFTTSLEEDAKRRDFSLNAIYLDPLTKKYIDPTGGIKDIKNKTIRFIGDINDRIEEDALRILRFVRFKNKFSFKIAEKNYFESISNKVFLLENISKERIKEELDKILLLKNNLEALKDLKKIGFFKVYLKEIDDLENCPGSKYHKEGNVWIHTLMAINVLNKIREKSDKNDSYFLDLYWTTLLHDIAKPICLTTNDRGENHYYNHEKVGVEIVKEKIGKTLKFSSKSIDKISWIIRNHLRVFKIREMKKLKSRHFMMHKYFEELLIVCEADHLGRRPTSKKEIEDIKSYYHDFKKNLSLKKFLSGRDILRKYPHLKGIAIGNKLREENNKILLDDFPNDITIGLTGDVMIGRLVDIVISNTNYSYIWGDTLQILKSNDLNLINLETTLTTSTKEVQKVFNFKASPDKVKALKIANIHICNLANNHILDYSQEGLLETISNLDIKNINHIGAGKDIFEAKKAIIMEVKNLKIGYLGATDNEPTWKATKNKAGVNYINTLEYEKIIPDIKKLKSQVDIVIFSMHWGGNMVEKPSAQFQNFAHKLIESGVDIFHGHSAHIFQGIEIYLGKPILYDTGDFIDDYYVDTRLRNDLSFLYLIYIKNKKIEQIKLLPTQISQMQVNKAKGDDYKFIYNRIKILNSEFNTTFFEKDGFIIINL